MPSVVKSSSPTEKKRFQVRGDGQGRDTAPGGAARADLAPATSTSKVATSAPFVGELRSLEFLSSRDTSALGANGLNSRFPQLPAPTYLDLSCCGFSSVTPPVLSSVPRLRVLGLAENRLTSLPKHLGQRLQELRDIDLSGNPLASVSFRTFVGTTSLEGIALDDHDLSQIDKSLEFLVDGFPRLQELSMSGMPGNEWPRLSRARLERFAARLPARDPDAIAEFE